ncbi:Vacuolar protein sorting-associated protein 35, partial [Rhizoclosmatium hyalinum]
ASREAEIRTRLQLLLPSTPSTSLQLYLAVAFSAAECRNEEATYEAIVNAITTYEDYVVDSKAQIPALTALIGTLRTVASTSTLSSEAYDTITGKVVVHCGRLLKKVDQCRCLLSAGHLYWVEERPGSEGYADHPVNDEMVAKSRGTTSVVSAAAAGKKSKLSGLLGDDDEKAGDEVPVAPVKVWRDGKKVLECLQKALKIADSVLETAVNTELFVEILEQYIWFYESGNDYINVSYLNSLIDLIQSNINNSSGISNTSTTAVPEKVVRHFSNIVARLKVLKDDEHEERRQRGLDMTSNDVYGGDAATGFGGVARAGGRWTQL